MQQELPELSVELGSTEPPHPTNSDLSHLGESQPHGKLQPGLCAGKGEGRTGLCAHQRL